MPETTNLKLPTFSPDDKPSWLGSWNGAMNTIDRAVGRIDADIVETDASIEVAQTAADAAKAAADAAQAAATALQGQVTQNKTDIQSQATMIEALQGDVNSFLPPDQIVIGKKYLIESGEYENSSGTLTINPGVNAGYLCTLGREHRIGLVCIDYATSTDFKRIGSAGGRSVRLIGFIKGNILSLPNAIWAGSTGKLYLIHSNDRYGFGFSYDSATDLTYFCYVGEGNTIVYNEYIPFIVERRMVIDVHGLDISLSGTPVGRVLNITALKS